MCLEELTTLNTIALKCGHKICNEDYDLIVKKQKGEQVRCPLGCQNKWLINLLRYVNLHPCHRPRYIIFKSPTCWWQTKDHRLSLEKPRANNLSPRLGWTRSRRNTDQSSRMHIGIDIQTRTWSNISQGNWHNKLKRDYCSLVSIYWQTTS